ncbi:MAG: hypothetical protein ACYS4W_11390 [Planctomycetota bacterium]|jgi:hypothetical protein
MVDVGFSLQATPVKQLGGLFAEARGSAALASPIAAAFGILINAFGFTKAVGYRDEGGPSSIELWSGSFGRGTIGAEGHLFRGRAFVQDWDRYKENLFY